MNWDYSRAAGVVRFVSAPRVRQFARSQKTENAEEVGVDIPILPESDALAGLPPLGVEQAADIACAVGHDCTLVVLVAEVAGAGEIAGRSSRPR